MRKLEKKNEKKKQNRKVTKRSPTCSASCKASEQRENKKIEHEKRTNDLEPGSILKRKL